MRNQLVKAEDQLKNLPNAVLEANAWLEDLEAIRTNICDLMHYLKRTNGPGHTFHDGVGYNSFPPTRPSTLAPVHRHRGHRRPVSQLQKLRPTRIVARPGRPTRQGIPGDLQ